MLNVDTQIFVHWLRDDLRSDEDALIDRQPWGVSAIVLWELYKLRQLGRLDIDLDDPELRRDLGRLHVWPISLHVCRYLQRLDFRSDPADEIIAATSLAHDAPLLTRDARMLSSKVVPLALS